MKVAVLAALSVLIAIPLAEARQRHLQNGLAVTSCDNDGHCTTLGARMPAASAREVRPEIKKTISDCSGSAGRARRQRQYNGCHRIRQDRCTCSRWRRLCRDVFKPISTIWKTITARACCSWVAFVPAIVRRPANIRAGKRWTYVSSGAASLIHAAICPAAGCSARSPLRTVCSKAGAGAIQIMVTRRSV